MRLRPSYSGVTSTLALVVALGGGAYAAAKRPADRAGTRRIESDARDRRADRQVGRRRCHAPRRVRRGDCCP
jgi:hypothetical protein